MREPTPLAVVGLACRFPGARNAAELWKNVLEDVSAIRPLPADRFHHERYYDPEIGAYGKSYSAIGGIVEDFPLDPRGLDLPPALLATADTAHRWALDVARSALEDAGLEPGALRGRKSGVIIGHARGSMLSSDLAFATAAEGLTRSLDEVPELGNVPAEARRSLASRAIAEIRRQYPSRGAADLSATLASALAGRISQAFGLTGRHLVVDAACASSFAAIDAASRALSLGHLDVAITGGASYSQELSVVLFAQSRALSPDGSFPFDERANGFISSDGLGFFVLMRLDDAIAAGARIRAVIRSVGASCDGKGKALWAPRKEGQVLAMRRAYEATGIDPATVGLLEGHATSTPIGDATEISAVDEVFGAALREAKRKLPIGSIKGNIGHAREAAGAAGLVKVIAALEHGMLPPTGNFRVPSRTIPWSDVSVEVSTTARPWASAGVRRAGVNAFGIGGLNYHVLVEEAPPARRIHSTGSGTTGGSGAPPPRLALEGLAPAPQPAPLEIAIVGLGLRVPGHTHPESLWTQLLEGRDTLVEVPADRWSKAIFYRSGSAEPHRTPAAKGAFLRGFTADWRRYRIPPKLVEQNDPLQFMLLESSVDALDDAHIDPATIDRTRTAVVMGTVFGSDYALELSLAIRATELAELTAAAAGRAGDRALIQALTAAVRRELPTINEDSSGSFSSSTLASRVAKTLDLMGPTFTVDAACASSFAAIEAAAELLRSGAADLAIAGGGDRAMRVQRYAAYAQAGVLSHHESVRSFEPDADGTIPGEGAAVLILQRLEDARAQGRPVYAVLKGIGSASEPAAIDRPPSEGLERAMRSALAQAQTSAAEVQLLEAHGLGAPAFDRAELDATRAVYGETSRESPLIVGAIKRQLGHAPGAAGAQAVLKTALALDRRGAPPLADRFASPPALEPFLQASTQTQSLSGDRAMAAVSGLSFGGASYHLVLESGGPARSARARPSPEVTGDGEADGWVVSASGESLDAIVHALRAGATPAPGPSGVAFVARDAAERGAKLDLLTKAARGPGAKALLRKQGVFARTRPAAQPLKIALLFSGQGSQYGGMTAEIARIVPRARELITRADTWLERHGRPALGRYLTEKTPIPNEVFLVQASLLVADLAAFEALRTLGIVPDFVTGHSYGDYPALVAAGALTFEAALEATVLRAEAIEATVAPGGMASISAPQKQVEALLATLVGVGAVVPSNINAPSQTVISGTPEGIEAALAAFSAQGIEAKKLAVPRAFHSPLMTEAREVLSRGLERIAITAPKVPFLSSVTGTFLETPLAIRDALAEQLTRPVDFIAQVERLVTSGARVFIECGPKAVLTGLVDQIVPLERDVDAIPTDDPNAPGAWALARVRAALECRASAGASATASSAPVEPGLTLLEGAEMLRAPGFDAFWRKSRPAIEALVKSLWDAERAATSAEPTSLPAAAPDLAPLGGNGATSITEATSANTSGATAGDEGRDGIRAFLVEAFCAQTGYPAELIEPDADLEADLGIDTVKQAQVLGKVRDRYQLKADASLSLADFPTINKIVDYVESQLAARAAQPEAPKRPRAPLVDVTAQRSSARPAKASASGAASGGLEVQSSIQPLPAPRPATAEDVAPKTNGHGLLQRSSRVVVLHLHGTARQIGRQHGEAMRSAIRDTMDRYEAFLGDRTLSALSVPEATRFFPALFDADTLEELHGVAEGVGVPFEHLLAYNLDAALFPAFTPGCTQALRTARANGGASIHAANEDSPLLLHLDGHQTRVVQVRRRSDGPLPERQTVLFSLAGQVAGPNAVSSDGLTITSCTLLDADPPSELPDAPPHPQLVKRLAESARTLEDAERIVRASKRTGRWSLLVSDASVDRALYLEYDGARILGTREVDGVWVATNHTLLGASSSAPEHSKNRLARASELLAGEAPVGAVSAQHALRDRYDCARGREVTHPTMNTIRRVDNVMSVVVEAQERRLFVTDRIESPSAEERAGFLTLEYARSADAPVGIRTNGHASPALAAPTQIHGPSAQIQPVAEVMRRSVPRLITEAAPAPRAPFAPRRALLIGDGPRAEAIASLLSARGTELIRAPTAGAALEIGSGLGEIEAIGLVLGSVPPDLGWAARRTGWVEDPFRLLRRVLSDRKLACIFAVTTLGGGLGFDNAGQGFAEHGAAVGLLKALRREVEGLQVQVLDTAVSASAEHVAQALLTELDGGSPRLEVGLFRNKRVRLQLVPRAADRFDEGAERLPRTWLLTGGARGITAEIGKRLAALYRPTLHLFGRQALPPEPQLARLRSLDAAGLEAHKRAILDELKATSKESAAREWRARTEALDRILEIDRNVAAMRQAGSVVEYHATDLTDRAALQGTLQAIRSTGSIEGLVHGAGVEIARPFAKKDDELLAATLGGKVEGLVHLLELTGEDPLTHLVAFSSVSGRFGGHGQADYSLANELLARRIGRLRHERPGLRATAIAWPAWAEVGLAARSSARTFLEATGQKLMSPAEGANHFLREMWCGLPEPEVVIAERLEALDLDRTLVSEEELPAWQAVATQVRHTPLLGELVTRETSEADRGERIIVERSFSASEPFLDQHRMGPTPILPAVIGLEVMSELASLDSDRWTIGDVQIHLPLKIGEGHRATVRAERRQDQLLLTTFARRPDGVVLDAERVHFSARRLPRRPLEARPLPPFEGELMRYPYPDSPDNTPGSRMIFHGPVFRCFRGLVITGEGSGLAKLVFPPTEALLPGSDPRGWRLPSALLDGSLQASGVLGRLLFGVTALPMGFGRVDMAQRALVASGASGKEVLLEIRQMKEGDELVSELYAEMDGEPLFQIERYRAQVLRKL